MESAKEIIVKAREAKGMNQTEVADKLKIGLRQYQNIEAGKFPKYKREQITELEDILGVKIYELIYAKKVHDDKFEESGSRTRNTTVQSKDVDVLVVINNLINQNDKLINQNDTLVKSNAEAISTNSRLVNTNEKIAYRVLAITEHDDQQKPPIFDAKTKELLAALSHAVVGETFGSSDEFLAFAGKILHDLPEKTSLKDTQNNLRR